MSVLWALIRKECLVEFRTVESIVLSMCMAIFLSAITGLGLSSSFLTPDNTAKVFPALLWITFIFAATISISRSFDYELRHRAIDGLLLSGASPVSIFLSKLLVNALIVFVAQCIMIVLLSGLLGVAVSEIFFGLLLLSCLVVVGYVSLAVLLAAVSSTSRLKNMLLPLILLPLLFPLFFAVLELTSQLMATKELAIGSTWFSLLVALDLIYLLLGVNLYGFVIRE